MKKNNLSREFKAFVIGTLLVLALGLYFIWAGSPVPNMQESIALNKRPIWEMPWFEFCIKGLLTVLVLQVYFLAIARPALRAIIYPSSDNEL
ncbi:hypothetical protein [Flocculibacter collagenilyticus]|uniref:hypothetical protein n=1 Tax=Flocculibacter collagenilyticus TaxID=2744479 RepID=UPI0018F36718|nr:hypothetical protein [Flocculibacter collagenilyticus]